MSGETHHAPQTISGRLSRGMVVVASEQLWPNMAGLLYAARRPGGLQKLRILHSGDAVRSGEPAARLAFYTRLRWPLVDVECVEVETDPASVRSAVETVRESLPGVTEWLVNATGGDEDDVCGAA